MSRHHNPGETPIPAETEYLISDVEELVNENIDQYLDGYPFKINIVDFMPSLLDGKPPVGINRVHNTYVDPIVKGPSEFSGMDLSFSFPVVPTSENPINIVLKWTNGIQCRLAIVDKRPILLVEDGEDTANILFSTIVEPNEMTSYLNSIGLPDSIWESSLKDLLQDVKGRDVRLQRSSKAVIDPFTDMEIVHDARYMKNDADEQELVQELCLNIDHLDQGVEGGNGEMYLPPGSVFRNMLRFERNETGELWVYKGAYKGKLRTGEFIDELVQIDPKLGIPNGKIMDKVLTILSQRPY